MYDREAGENLQYHKTNLAKVQNIFYSQDNAVKRSHLTLSKKYSELSTQIQPQ